MGKGKKKKKGGGNRGQQQQQQHRQKQQHSKQQDRQHKQRMRKEERRKQWEDPAWKEDFRRFQGQLRAIGMCIVDVTGDGNCMFRAVSDQLEQTPNRHGRYRQECVAYMRENPEYFMPFLVDQSMDDYCDMMQVNCEWGTQLELSAMTHCLRINIVVHQLDQPRWQMDCPESGRPTIHLSYHNGDHYASVRNLDGSPHTTEPVWQISSGSSSGSKNNNKKKKKKSINKKNQEDTNISDEVALVMAATGVRDVELVKQTLVEQMYNVEMTIAIVSQLADDAGFYSDDDDDDEDNWDDDEPGWEVVDYSKYKNKNKNQQQKKGNQNNAAAAQKKKHQSNKRANRETRRYVELQQKKKLSNKERQEFHKLRKFVDQADIDAMLSGGGHARAAPEPVIANNNVAAPAEEDEVFEDMGTLQI